MQTFWYQLTQVQLEKWPLKRSKREREISFVMLPTVSKHWRNGELMLIWWYKWKSENFLNFIHCDRLQRGKADKMQHLFQRWRPHTVHFQALVGSTALLAWRTIRNCFIADFGLATYRCNKSNDRKMLVTTIPRSSSCARTRQSVVSVIVKCRRCVCNIYLCVELTSYGQICLKLMLIWIHVVKSDSWFRSCGLFWNMFHVHWTINTCICCDREKLLMAVKVLTDSFVVIVAGPHASDCKLLLSETLYA